MVRGRTVNGDDCPVSDLNIVVNSVEHRAYLTPQEGGKIALDARWGKICFAAIFSRAWTVAVRGETTYLDARGGTICFALGRARREIRPPF